MNTSKSYNLDFFILLSLIPWKNLFIVKRFFSFPIPDFPGVYTRGELDSDTFVLSVGIYLSPCKVQVRFGVLQKVCKPWAKIMVMIG